jgi:hypothetical protein
MKRTRLLAVLLLLLAQSTSLRGQCDLHIDYSVKDLPTSSLGTLKLLMPDGTVFVLFRDTCRQTEFSCRLEQLGEYRMTATFTDGIKCNESLEQVFTLTGEEYLVEVLVHFRLERKGFSDLSCKDSIPSGNFTITRYLHSSPFVKIKYLYTNNGNSDEFPGPVFSIINDSQDTLYGEWLPGYFWGALSRWKDGDYVGYYVGSIDTDWVEEPPLFPGQKKKAWVASFGRITPPGKYRFRLYYTTDSPYVSKRSAGLTRETETFRWWCSVSKWYLLVCDFEIQPEEPPTPTSDTTSAL